jgi:hypothetical protein
MQVLDPRISLDGMLEDCADDETTLAHVRRCRASLQDHLNDHYTLHPVSTEMVTTHNTVSSSAPRMRADSDSDLFSRYSCQVQAPSISKEVHDYFALNPANARALRLPPLKWWQANQARFPHLALLARDVFSIAGMSLFS